MTWFSLALAGLVGMNPTVPLHSAAHLPSLSDPGTGSFEVTGEVEGSKSGEASFTFTDSPGADQLIIEITDAAGGQGIPSFALTLSRTGENLPAVPEPGTYEIGDDETGPDVFQAIFVDISMTGPSAGYVTVEGYGGQLEIEHASETEIRGTFQFDAIEQDPETRETFGDVEVTGGSFSATLDG